MKSLYEKKMVKAVKKAAATDRNVTFWEGTQEAGRGNRPFWVFATPEGDVVTHFPHFWDGETHYMEYQC